MTRVVIKVPASTSNLGSGFDTLGLAVKLYTQVDVRVAGSRGIRITSPAAGQAHTGLMKLLEEAANLFFQSSSLEAFGLKIAVTGNVPVARGLGYSATVRVGVLAALNEICGTQANRRSLLNLATQLEGHPDNASPSVFGAFTVSGVLEKKSTAGMFSPLPKNRPLTPGLSPGGGEGEDQNKVRCINFRVSEALRLVTLIPDFPISTEEARKLMPASFSKTDATHGLNRAALITAAFASGELESLRGVFDDRIHQPYREPLIPALRQVVAAGENAGALGGFLSGSGSAIICLALEEPKAIGEAMRQVLPNSQVLILEPDNHGFIVE
jgi:homoserine kinase